MKAFVSAGVVACTSVLLKRAQADDARDRPL